VVSPDRIEHADITRTLEKSKPAEPFFIDGRVDHVTIACQLTKCARSIVKAEDLNARSSPACVPWTAA